MADFEWKKNMVCTGTYTLLESDKFLDQFEDADIPFESAGDVKLSKLRYNLRTTNNPHFDQGLTLELEQNFLTDLQKIYRVEMRKGDDTPQNIIRRLAAVFAAPTNKTIGDVAEQVDKDLKFPDEE
jgi:hypothetical protein